MNDSLVIAIPVRAMRGGKTRLAGVLAPGERSELVADLLAHVLEQVVSARVADAVLVISPDDAVLELAAAVHPSVIGLQQPLENPGLNAGLEQGRQWAIDRGATRFMTLFADLPTLKPADIRELTAIDAPLVLATDRHGQGSNSVLLRLDTAARELPFAFGERSARRHLAAARKLGLSPVVLENPGIGFDLDTPDDLALLRRGAAETRVAMDGVIAPWDLLAGLAAGAGIRS